MSIISKIQAAINHFRSIKRMLKNTLSWKNIKKVVKEKINNFFEKHPFIHKMVIGTQIFVLAYGSEGFFRIGDSIIGVEGIVSIITKYGAYFCALFCLFQIGSIILRATKRNEKTIGETANE